jgi:Type II secretion system (T2SS), protein G
VRRILAFWPLGLLPAVATLILTTGLGSIVALNISKALTDLTALDAALHDYKSRHGDFPGERDGLTALTGAGEPLVHIAKDPWGNTYLYRHAAGTDSYLVYSPGVNHRDDGGLGDDVILGPKKYRCADYGVNCVPDTAHLFGWIAFVLAGLSLAVGIIRRSATLSRLARLPNNRWRGP